MNQYKKVFNEETNFKKKPSSQQSPVSIQYSQHVLSNSATSTVQLSPTETTKVNNSVQQSNSTNPTTREPTTLIIPFSQSNPNPGPIPAPTIAASKSPLVVVSNQPQTKPQSPFHPPHLAHHLNSNNSNCKICLKILQFIVHKIGFAYTQIK